MYIIVTDSITLYRIETEIYIICCIYCIRDIVAYMNIYTFENNY